MTITLNGTTGITSTGITETSDGKVGIGTSSHYDASTKLTVAGRINTSNGTAIGSMNYGGGAVVNIGSLSNHPVQLMTNNTTRVVVDSAGRVTMPYQPMFSAYASASYTPAANAILSMPNVRSNIGNHYDSANCRFTAPITGVYHFVATIGFNGTGTYYGMYVNGTRRYDVEGTGGWETATMSVYVELSASDYVDLRAISGGMTMDSGNWSYWSGMLAA